MAQSKKSGSTPEEYEKLGRAVEAAIITDYMEMLRSTHKQIWSSFVRGLFAGLGGVIGATLVVAILVELLQLFGGTPVIGHYLTSVGQTIETHSTPKP